MESKYQSYDVINIGKYQFRFYKAEDGTEYLLRQDVEGALNSSSKLNEVITALDTMYAAARLKLQSNQVHFSGEQIVASTEKTDGVEVKITITPGMVARDIAEDLKSKKPVFI